MNAVINVALPVFAVILLGFLAGRGRILGLTASEALNAFVYWIALPPLLFLAMVEIPLDDVLRPHFVGAYLGGVLLVWLAGGLLGAIVHRPGPAASVMQGMNAGFSNTGYMGIPLFVAAFGQAGLAPALLATVIMSAVCVGIAVVGLELAGGKRRGLLHALAGVAGALVSNPLVMAPVAGLAWARLDLPLPVPVETLLDLLAAAASPCALFAIGLFLARQPLRGGLVEAGWIAALKLLWHPLATALLAATIFPMEPFWTASAILLAALPTGALTFVVAARYGVYVQRTSTVILVSTLASVVTVSLLLAVIVPAIAPS